MSGKKGLIAFDLIGTLSNSAERYSSAFAAICERYGLSRPDRNKIRSALGEKNLLEIIREFIHEEESAHLDLAEFMSSCNNYCDALLTCEGWEEDLYPHVRETLEKLSTDYEIGIYTGIRLAPALKLIDFHGLNDLVNPRYIQAKDQKKDKGLSTIDLKAGQLEVIKTRFNDAQNESLPFYVVGDSPSDASAADKMGADFLGYASSLVKQRAFANKGIAPAAYFDCFSKFPLIGADKQFALSADKTTQANKHEF